MIQLVHAAFYVALGFVLLLAIVVAMRLLRGEINTKNLLYGRTGKGTLYFSPERVQLLVFTLGFSGWYLLQVMQSRGSGKLPDIPNEALFFLGGSHLIYLGGKAVAMLAISKKEGED